MRVPFNAYGFNAVFSDGTLFINKQYIGEFTGLKEAKEFCYGLHLAGELGVYEEDQVTLSEQDIIITLNESSDFDKVTESLVESFKYMVETKHYYPSNALVTLRETKGLDYFDKIDYVLRDGSTVLLDSETNKKLNNFIKLDETNVLLEHMLKSGECFISVVSHLLEETNGN
jgi:hypothetical protein